MLKLSGWPRLTWDRVPSRARRGFLCMRRWGRGPEAALSAVRVRPPLAASVPAGGPHFGPPRREARGANLRVRARRLPGAGGVGVRGATRGVMPRQACPRPDSLGRNLRSKTRWFTGFCNSHQVSHFATFFIDARAKISVAESRKSSTYGGIAPRTGTGVRRSPTSVFLGAHRAGYCSRRPSRSEAGRGRHWGPGVAGFGRPERPPSLRPPRER